MNKIILLSLILISISTYSYAGDCYYDPNGSISIAEFFAGKCAPIQTQVIAAHKDWSRIKKPTKSTVRNKYAKKGRRGRVMSLSRQFADKGYGMRIIRSTNSYGVKVFDYEISLPCFYTTPGNNPCRRGRFRR